MMHGQKNIKFII